MSIKSYILENEFKVTVLKGKVNVLNYTDIVSFNETNILIKGENCTVNIKGSSLVIKRLLIDELLVVGKITSIEFR